MCSSEVLTIASCALLSVRRGGRALIASARYMIFALMGSGLFLIGVIFTYSVTGHLLFPQLHTAIADLWASGGHRFSVTMSLGLITAGLAIKSGLFPFHLWMPDTYGQATPASSGILSGVVSKGYIVFLIKVIYQVIGIDVFAATGIQTVLLLFGIGGMIAGSVSAIFARRLTTMIAYSSAAQIGYIYMGLGMGTQARPGGGAVPDRVPRPDQAHAVSVRCGPGGRLRRTPGTSTASGPPPTGTPPPAAYSPWAPCPW